MRLTCLVCRELLVPSDDVNAARCGHFFHYLCWLGWLERSKTCPQCRKKTSEREIFRIYFNTTEGEGEEVDAASVNHKIDSLTFNLRLKDKDLTTAKEQLEKEVSHNKGLRCEIKKYRGKLEEAQTSRQCLEEKVQYLQQQGREAQQAKAEILSLRTKLDRLQKMETILHGNIEDVQKVLDTTNFSPEGMRSLALFTSSLKRALEESKERHKQIREAHNSDKAEMRKFKAHISELTKALENADMAKKHLEDDVSHLENEKKTLTAKIQDLEQAILSPSANSVRDKALRRFLAESPAPNSMQQFREVEDKINENLLSPVVTAPGRSFSASQIESSQNSSVVTLDGSPFLGIQPHIVKGPCYPSKPKNNVAGGALSKLSIFNKRLHPSNQSVSVRHTSQFGETYDGLGGHSKYEEFPEPCGKKVKKLKSDCNLHLKAKKVSAPVGVPKLNQFDGFIKI